MESNEFIDEDMDEKEKNQLIEELREECICHTCPTYNNCTRKSKELLYCILGSSDCPIHKRKCQCPEECPVYQKYGFKSSFYCLKNKDIKKNKLIYEKKVYRV